METQSPKENEVTLRGVITASQRDVDNNVVAIDILTDDECFEVELNELGVELFDFLDEDVEVTGMLKKGRRRHGTKLIRVTNYEWLENQAYEFKRTRIDALIGRGIAA